MKVQRTKSNEKGFAIVTVLFIIGILLVLATALSLTAISNSQLAVNSGTHQQAFLVAESAVADVVTQLGNGSIVYSASGPSTGTRTLNAAQGSGTYAYSVTFNTNTSSPLIARNPLYGAGSCSGNFTDPGPGCVVIPAAIPSTPVRYTAFIYVAATYSGRNVAAEAMAVSNDISSNGAEVFTNSTGTQGGTNSVIASDPNDPNGKQHDILVQSNSNWTVNGNPTVDGVVNTAGSSDQAKAPSGCSPPACQANVNQPAWPFPSNNLSQAKSFWLQAAQANSCYYSDASAVPSNLKVSAGTVCYIDGSTTLDLKNYSITNDGGLLVVVPTVKETGNSSNAGYQLTSNCSNSCTCKKKAQLVDLSTGGVAMHGVGTGKGNPTSQGLIFVPSATFQNVGNNTFYGAVIANGFAVGGTGGMNGDVCAAQGVISSPGYSIAAWGLDDQD